jgi:hypothetical protein
MTFTQLENKLVTLSIPPLFHVLTWPAQKPETIQTQLLELEDLVSAAAATSEITLLRELEIAEDMRFETYARERRTQMTRTQKAYDEQLEAFQIERMRVLADESDVPIDQMGVGKGNGKARAKIGCELEVRGGLEQVMIGTEESGELDSFFSQGDEKEWEATTQQLQQPQDQEISRQSKKKKEKAIVGSRTGSRAVTKKAMNPVILADEDIEDEREIMGHYHRRR